MTCALTAECPVKFDADRHRYTLNGRELVSVSSVIKRVSPPFDPDGQITRRCADREGITVDELRGRWDAKRDASVERGRSIHAALQAFVENQMVFGDHAHHIEQLKRWPFAGRLHCEKILWSAELGIAGMTDLIEVTGPMRCKIFDFKTNEKLSPENRWNDFLKPPVNHLAATDYQKYELQLNLYALMLKLMGWTVERLTLFHVGHDGNWKSWRLQFREADCMAIVKAVV